MRLPALLLFCLSLSANAQNWALLNPAYKYNYSNDGTDTISNQIFVTHIDTLGVDSLLFHLNLIVGPCGIGDGPNDYHIDLSAPQFLLRTCLFHNDQWLFSDSAHYMVNSTAEVGTSWTFRLEDSTQASVTLADTATVLGVLDSVRTLVTLLGDTVTLSKAHGIVRWKLAGEAAYDLIGVHGLDLGGLIPSLADFYPYQAGDVVQYHSGYWYNMHSAEIINQYHITGRTDYSASIVFTATRFWANRPYSSGAWDYGSDNSSLTISLQWYLMNAALSYPGEFIRDDQEPTEAMIAQHGFNTSGYYEIKSTLDYLYPDLTLIAVVNDSDSSCASVSPLAVLTSYWKMDTEVGLRGYRKDQLLAGTYLVLEGAVINGDTIGTISPATSFVGVGPDGLEANAEPLYPVPADDHITVPYAVPGEPYDILDVQGKIVITNTFSAPLEAEVLRLQPGVYLLRMQDRTPQRFIIAR